MPAIPLLLWGATAIGGLFFASQALKEADKTAQNLTTLLLVGGVVYFLVLNPKLVKKVLGG